MRCTTILYTIDCRSRGTKDPGEQLGPIAPGVSSTTTVETSRASNGANDIESKRDVCSTRSAYQPFDQEVLRKQWL
ncbi:uncharacterized protein ARMOST_16676 [Armillaria ostoyae]|uniref:Uncharacterized protein n=1 Tax=Armillaria ostoyae TaxID=47428 RepID=A0A284RWW9_ARMOS|nr:uncharacterized protein ARMOST_16676 [Armillaria ostoyae]